MKKPSSAVGAALWTSAGVVGLYLLGAVLIWADDSIFHTRWLYDQSPSELRHFIVFLYYPLFDFLINRLGLRL